MTASIKRVHLLRMLIVLTLLFIFAQISLVLISNYITGLFDIVRVALTPALLFSKPIFGALAQLLLAQLILYAMFVYIVWFVTVSIAELFGLPIILMYLLGFLMWLFGVTAIMVINTYYVPHSIFTTIIRHFLLKDLLSDDQLTMAFSITGLVGLLLLGLTALNIFIRLLTGQHIVRHACLLIVIFCWAMFIKGYSLFIPHNHPPVSQATQLPNVVIVGFDSLRPDFLGFFNPRAFTPNFDQFLKSSITFSQTYTPTARTLPSWMSILTGQYPIEDGMRENNTPFSLLKKSETLAEVLKRAGYETVYATDDRRFNTIDNSLGFDKVIGPAGNVSDYLIGTINDFPLSNLIIPTLVGKKLFPFNHANHGAAETYSPQNFLDQLNEVLHQSRQKPLFLAVHFNLSGWPFYWFNDKAAYNADDINSYQNAVLGDDRLLADFLRMLKRNNLLNHTIVVLLSDHGITLALHGDRAITEEAYQGNKSEMKVKRTRYADAKAVNLDPREMQVKGKEMSFNFKSGNLSPFNMKDYGVDTSYGYGSDILSLKQNHALLAIKGYGVDIGAPHVVAGFSSLIDVAPTLLDILRLPSLKAASGISLAAYLYSMDGHLSVYRPLYFETAYSLAEIEQRDIVLASVVAKSLHYFAIDGRNGSVTLSPQIIPVLIENKQRAILQGDWFLAYYPVSQRYTFTTQQKSNNTVLNIQSHVLPPYFVLLNLKTGQWTTEMDQPMVSASPMKELKEQLFKFYGDEMKVYKGL